MVSKLVSLALSQRITGFAILPVLLVLYVYYIDTVFFLNESFYTTLYAESPLVYALVYLVCLFILFYHGNKGITDVFKDYVHHPMIQRIAIRLLNIILISLFLNSVYLNIIQI